MSFHCDRDAPRFGNRYSGKSLFNRDRGTKYRQLKAKNAAIPLQIELRNFEEPPTIS
jgi:hypothetical protein